MANPDVERITTAEAAEQIKQERRASDQEKVLARLIELCRETGSVTTDGYDGLLKVLDIEGLSITRLHSVIWHLQKRPAKIQFFSRFKIDGTMIYKRGLKIIVLQGVFV